MSSRTLLCSIGSKTLKRPSLNWVPVLNHDRSMLLDKRTLNILSIHKWLIAKTVFYNCGKASGTCACCAVLVKSTSYLYIMSQTDFLFAIFHSGHKNDT